MKTSIKVAALAGLAALVTACGGGNDNFTARQNLVDKLSSYENVQSYITNVTGEDQLCFTNKYGWEHQCMGVDGMNIADTSWSPTGDAIAVLANNQRFPGCENDCDLSIVEPKNNQSYSIWFMYDEAVPMISPEKLLGWSADGEFVYFLAQTKFSPESDYQIFRINPKGKEHYEGVGNSPLEARAEQISNYGSDVYISRFGDSVISPDGTYIALVFDSKKDLRTGIALAKTEPGSGMAIVARDSSPWQGPNTGVEYFNPIFSPDGTKLLYQSLANYGDDLELMVADLKTGDKTVIYSADNNNSHIIGYAWAPNTNLIAVEFLPGEDNIWIVPADGSEKIRQFTKCDTDALFASWNSAGDTLTYSCGKNLLIQGLSGDAQIISGMERIFEYHLEQRPAGWAP